MPRWVSTALLAVALVVGCGGSGAGYGGAAGSGAAGTRADGGGDLCPDMIGLPSGDSCFKIVTVQPGSNDGCVLAVADPVASNGVVGASLMVSVDPSTGTLTVGTNASLGTGTISCNQAMLTRDERPSLDVLSSCTWHQVDTSMVTITATDEFDIAVTEVQDMSIGCTSETMPVGGACTSTWTWHMVQNTAVSPTSNPPCK
jgi:hypothetical protein